jgi:hypothetical protein
MIIGAAHLWDRQGLRTLHIFATIFRQISGGIERIFDLLKEDLAFCKAIIS